MYEKLQVGPWYSTPHPTIDFETYSEAGYRWVEAVQKWKHIDPDAGPSAKPGLFYVGMAVYSEHPSTEVLCLKYDLLDGKGRRIWTPEIEKPTQLLFHVMTGGIIEAHNVGFEYYIWNNVCAKKYGWPKLLTEQCRCTMSKVLSAGCRGALVNAGEDLNSPIRKDKKLGNEVINRFSKPHNPTKKDPRRRILPLEDLRLCDALYNYCDLDVASEMKISELVPDLLPSELDLWLLDQRTNRHGIKVDTSLVKSCSSILKQAKEKYEPELIRLTNGAAKTANQTAKILEWLHNRGMHLEDLQEKTISDILKDKERLLAPDIRRVLEIRVSLASSSVAKLKPLIYKVSKDGYLRDSLVYYGANTGRWAGRGLQPQNLPNSGPDVKRCDNCNKTFGIGSRCPYCMRMGYTRDYKWNERSIEDAISILNTGSLETVEYYYKDAIELISCCIRSMLISSPGYDLIASDYSAIEARVQAALSGEQWRLDVFNTHGKIYEMSASKITGIPFEEFIRHKKETGEHHPHRKTGKVAELASGYQGWVGAWIRFGADKIFNNEEDIKQAVLTWRAQSPQITKAWAELEKAAIQAVQYPGQCFGYRGVSYGVKEDVLYCRLPSGRFISYRKPRLKQVERYGKMSLSLSYTGRVKVNGREIFGKVDLYGGKLFQNAVQAISRDIMAYAMINLDKAGYTILLTVHDEIIAETLEGRGSVEEFERIMETVPAWAQGWPIKASGGYRAKRYRK